ncbi:MAG: RNA polymerase sigma factor, partial [Myxococcaceae bacterium]
MFRRCLRLVGEEPLAMDLLQETFLRAHRYQRTYRGPTPLSWLLTIADRSSFDALRRKVPVTDPEELKRFLEKEADPVEPVFVHSR